MPETSRRKDLRCARDYSSTRFLGALGIVAVSYFATLMVLDYWGGAPVVVSPIKEPAYNAASLPRVSTGQTLAFGNGQNRNALLSGWSDPEPDAVWSDGHASYWLRR